MPSLKEVFEEVGLRVGNVNFFSKGKNAQEIEMLSNLHKALRKQVDTEFSSENLDFLHDLHKLYQADKRRNPLMPYTNSPELVLLYNKYVARNSESEINLPATIGNALHEEAKKGGLTLESFSNAANEIINLMQKDTIKRFQELPAVKDLRPEAKPEQALIDRPDLRSRLRALGDAVLAAMSSLIARIQKSIADFVGSAKKPNQENPTPTKEAILAKSQNIHQQFPAEKNIVQKSENLQASMLSKPPITPLKNIDKQRMHEALSKLKEAQKLATLDNQDPDLKTLKPK